MYDTDRPAFLERDLVRLSVATGRSMVQYHGGEPVCIHTVGKGATDFSNVKSITFCVLQLVD